MSFSQIEPITEEESRLIAGIPVKNLWLLIFYASKLYPLLKNSKVQLESNPEDTADLVAEILCTQVEQRLRRNLNRSFESRSGVLTRIRGSIDILKTERHSLLKKGKVACIYEDLTVDTPKNQFVKAALKSIARCNLKPELSRSCMKLSNRLSYLGVSDSNYRNHQAIIPRIGPHDREDQMMVAAAELAFALALPTETKGTALLPNPSKDIYKVRALFEQAIGGFYKTVLDAKAWEVRTGSRLSWQARASGPSKLMEALPGMQTDISLTQLETGKHLVIDTKFTSITKAGQYNSHTLKSGYIYQMYAYLRSQEKMEDRHSFTSSGMLLHPTMDEEFQEAINIQGHDFWFCTINLAESTQNIRKRLLYLIDLCFQQPYNF